MRLTSSSLAVLLLASLGVTGICRAGTATSVNGLFYTGVNNSGGLLAGGAQDSHWTVVAADVANNLYTGTSTYTGNSYVVGGGNVDAAWVANTSAAQWITAPGAKTAGGTVNAGGDQLPGNGTTGNNAATYVYQLTFTIGGSTTGGTTVANHVSISLTIASDDKYTIYVNPTYGASGITSAASGTRNNAWNNTSAEYLQNYTGDGHTDNADFVIGTNTIWVVVDNTNSITGDSNSTALNPSGLLVYQVGSAVLIDGKPVPEVGAILPVLGALGLFALRRFRLRNA